MWTHSFWLIGSFAMNAQSSTRPTCFQKVAAGGLAVKGAGAGTPSGLGTRDCGGLGAAAGEWQWGCVPPLRRPETLYCWTGSAAAGSAA